MIAELGLTLEDDALEEALGAIEQKDDKIAFPDFLKWWNKAGKLMKRNALKKAIADRKAAELEVERLEQESKARAPLQTPVPFSCYTLYSRSAGVDVLCCYKPLPIAVACTPCISTGRQSGGGIRPNTIGFRPR